MGPVHTPLLTNVVTPTGPGATTPTEFGIVGRTATSRVETWPDHSSRRPEHAGTAEARPTR